MRNYNNSRPYDVTYLEILRLVFRFDNQGHQSAHRKSNNLGFLATARAIDTRCCSPPDN